MTEVVTTPTMTVETWPLARLKPHPRNPRGAVDPSTVRELADSIADVGMLSPIIVTPAGLIVGGHRRFAAARLARLEAVPVTVRDLAPSEQLVIMLVENLQRADLSPLAEARGFSALMDDGLTVADIVRLTGVSRERVTDRLALLWLDDETAGMFDRGELPNGAVHVLTAVEDLDRRHDLARRVASHDLTLSGLRKAVGIDKAAASRVAAGMPRTVLEDRRYSGSTNVAGRCLVCQETRERLIAALAALTRAERVIRDNVSDIAVPARPSILKEVTHAR